MKKQVIVTVKNLRKTPESQAVSNAALVISSKKLEQALEKRKRDARDNEEFTQWK